MSWLTRVAVIVAAGAVVLASAIGGRDALITLGVAATSFLLLVAALGALLFALGRGEFPARIGRDIVEFSTDAAATAASLRALDDAVTDLSARFDELVASLDASDEGV
jgi:hypothetical protein